MIQITIFQNHEKQYVGFHCIGHSGYARSGRDIICAGVSSLVVNAINSIEQFTSQTFQVDVEEKTGLIDLKLDNPAGGDAELLIKSMILGLQGIQKDYGNEYIILNFKEV